LVEKAPYLICALHIVSHLNLCKDIYRKMAAWLYTPFFKINFNINMQPNQITKIKKPPKKGGKTWEVLCYALR
jgi:hypothetical protein